jgi:YjbE family integral membrane protein
MSWDFIFAFLSITLIDIVLAGDNAVIIAMAARPLPPAQRKTVIIIGAGLAVVLRVLTTFIVAQLLLVPFLSAAGGILVGWIAVKLLQEQEEMEETHGKETKGFWHAIWIIAVADFIMSTDNIIAIGGASRGSFGLILFGLGLSIPIIMFCASWIANLMDRYPWLAYVGAGILGWTAGFMIVDDKKVIELLIGESRLLHWGIPLGVTAVVIVLGKWLAKGATPSVQKETSVSKE